MDSEKATTVGTSGPSIFRLGTLRAGIAIGNLHLNNTALVMNVRVSLI